MNRRRVLVSAATLACALHVIPAAFAASAPPAPLRIGIITELSGPNAHLGKGVQDTIALYIKTHGDTVAGRKVEVIYRDAPGASPELARRHAQDLIARDKVDFIAGFGFTPNALAVAPVVTEAKMPMIITNTAGTSIITLKSPYIARLSFTQAQITTPLAQWAAQNGMKNVYTMVADYAPGLDAEKAFIKAFEAAGGKIVGSVRMPLANTEFGPYLQRAQDAKPDAIFAFVPSSDTGAQLVKTFKERGLDKQGIKLLTDGSTADDMVLDSIGDVAIGLITSHHYSMAHDSPENKAFIDAYRAAYGKDARVNHYLVGSWDGMEAIYEVTRRLDGKIDGDKVMEVLRTLKIQSPRGPIWLDENRDIVQNMYIRRVEKRPDGHLYNVEIATFPAVKDTGK